ncbi:molybdate ABC transporter permease subunit [Gulosibacter macacae]|uniref:Molybdate ABC transporter permease subunit n=1 Tax=Gulosibacter macacae TaxID=2488791 RepID=A0A3P3VSJ4_9MICO|nr:molybdate ABC transporter permease subunit [Gulosibacter macacae]
MPGWVRWAGALLAALLALPLAGLLSQVDWAEFWALITSRSAFVSLELSLRSSLAATICSLIIGVPVALVLARGGIPDVVLKVVRTLVLLPLVLPPVVGGIALIATFGRRGLVGSLVLPFGVEIGFTTLAVIMAQTFVAMPFLVLTLEGALRSRSTDFEAVALTLGASPTRALWAVTLPLLWPSLLTGTVLTFARALGEFGATITFAGSLEGVSRTLPLEIYLQREIDQRAAVALSILLVIVATVIVAIAYQAPGGPAANRRDRRLGAPARSGLDEASTTAPAAVVPDRAITVRDDAAPHDAVPVSPARLSDTKPSATPTDPVPLDAHIVLTERDIDVRLRAAAGETVAVIGPNGAGKSSVIDAISGLLDLDAGKIQLGDTVLDHPDARVRVPAQRRGIARLGQNPLLFPHLDLGANVAFGQRMAGKSRREALAAATTWLIRTGSGGLDRRLPREVSGGQAQRAAIARALATSPRLCLWDEPFAALDVESAPRQRELLAAHSRGRTAVLITHDLADVRALADRVVVIEAGRVVQDAPVVEFLAAPAPGFAASFVGT